MCSLFDRKDTYLILNIKYLPLENLKLILWGDIINFNPAVTYYTDNQ